MGMVRARDRETDQMTGNSFPHYVHSIVCFYSTINFLAVSVKQLAVKTASEMI